jgi:serine/threonine protein kinase
MDSFAPGSWPGFDVACLSCGSGCRPVDRFCSQCGRRDPSGREAAISDDDLLTSPTLVAGESGPPLQNTAPSGGTFPTFVAPGEVADEPTLMKAGRRERLRLSTLTLESMIRPNSVFGRRYRIQRVVGHGAMGYVCSAVDESIDEIVALKILSVPITEDPDAFARFKMELKLARRIRHRNVVQSFDLGFAEGYPFISMEYIDADNILKHLNRRLFDEAAALLIARQVLRGLRAAHDLGIVHRDIKPENILLNKDRIAFITDFGIATSPQFDRRRELAGTPDYMAPEQLRCEEVVPASDLYSCGVMLYRMITGRLPYRADSVNAILDAHLNAAPDPIDPELASEETREMISWMLAKRVADRPQSAAELLSRIDRHLKSQETRLSASKRVTVLLVEHDPETMQFIRGVLEGEGFRVVAASNARDAVNSAFEQTPSVILLDAKIRGGFELPVEESAAEAADGLGFVRIVQRDEKLKDVPIVLMTDETLSNIDAKFEQAGVAEVMIKPLEAGDVLEAAKLAKVAAG